MSNFEARAWNLRAWLSTAENLKITADVIWQTMIPNGDFSEFGEKMMQTPEPPNVRIRQCYLFIAGLSIENLIKGILVSMNHEIFHENGRFRWKTHDLVWLFGEAKIELDDARNELVRRMKSFVEWVGRYPIPVKAEGFADQKHDLTSQYDHEIFTNLFNELADVLNSKLGKFKWSPDTRETFDENELDLLARIISAFPSISSKKEVVELIPRFNVGIEEMIKKITHMGDGEFADMLKAPRL